MSNDTRNNRPPEFSEDQLKMPSSSTPTPKAEHHGHLGIILIVLIVAMASVLGGLYLWYANVFEVGSVSTTYAPPERDVPEMPNDPETANANASVAELDAVSPSTELQAIKADIVSTNLRQLDSELTAIDAELGFEPYTPPSTPEPLPPTTSAAQTEPTADPNDNPLTEPAPTSTESITDTDVTEIQ